MSKAMQSAPLSATTRRRGRPPRESARNGAAPVQSLSRALGLLEAIADAEEGISLSALATRVGLAASTVHRLLNTLQQHRFATLDAERGVWFVGLKAFTVGNAFLANRDVVRVARPTMHRLMERSGESVNLAILDGVEAVFLSQVQCREMMRMLVHLGGRAPIHASGAGKALLATLDSASVDALLSGDGLARYTDNTITSAPDLHRALQEVRVRGFAVDDEEHAIGLRCVAATVFDQHADALAALSISGPRARVTDDRIQALGALVRAAADEVTGAVGGVLPGWRTPPSRAEHDRN